MRFLALALVLIVPFFGCDSSDPPTDGGTVMTACVRHSDCDDGVFCNGTELCQPDDPAADTIGCTLGVRPCGEDQVCSETSLRCEIDCGLAPDGDGDGSPAIGCGGMDCDDDDPNRFPGNPEVCDPDQHDEDCDPRTFGDRDQDGDGSIDALCCNVDPEGGPTFCGDDCNDRRRDARPGLSEECDALDNDCDGAVDEGVSLEGYVDADFDLHGAADMPISSCPGLPGFSTVADDCDDGDPARHGAQVEVCDEIDNDCDGVTDESPASTTWYRDADDDGFGSANSGFTVACVPPLGHVLRLGDCDDDRLDISPLAPEMCNGRDDNCDGRANYTFGAGDGEDDDGDTYADRACGGPDCDDADPDVYPTAPELMDGEDNDCDGTIDEAPGTVPWWIDRDGDGWGTDAEPSIESVTRPDGRAARGGDCNDGDASVHPGVPDGCDGLDVDCDLIIDESAPRIAFYLDADGDGWGSGDASTAVLACRAPAGTSERPLDCDDSNAMRYPGASERCNGEDTDCDTRIDEDSDRPWYPDLDGDGFGDPTSPSLSCAAGAGYVDNMNDCDDTDASAYPMGVEECDGADDDCDGAVDETTAAACADFPRSVGTCIGGLCSLTCDAGFGDCNGFEGDGCETNIANNTDHCGACFTACSPADTCGVSAPSACDMAPVVQLAAGEGFTYARRVGGRLAVWGDGTTVGAHGAGYTTDQTTAARGAAPTLVDVGAGWKSGIGVTTDGRAYAWGSNTTGRLGDGTTSHRPGGAYVAGLTGNVMHASIGYDHGCAVVREAPGGPTVNHLYCWGSNAHGQLGSGVASPSLVPEIVPGIEDAVQVGCGNGMTCVLRNNAVDGNYVSCFGRGNGGELGNGLGVSSTAPVRVISLPPDVVELIPGSGSRACVRTASLRVYCWGQWPGDGSGSSTAPVIVAGIDDALAASQGPSGAPDRFQTERGVACVIREAGGANEVWCWGSNQAGSLGTGVTGTSPSPVRVMVNPPGSGDMGPSVPIVGAVAIAAGYHHACAALVDGTIQCWGENTNGEGGFGTIVTVTDPPKVIGLP